MFHLVPPQVLSTLSSLSTILSYLVGILNRHQESEPYIVLVDPLNYVLSLRVHVIVSYPGPETYK